MKENLPVISIMSTVEKVIMPNPPHWMSTSTTHWPKRLSRLPVSTTTRPVTQVADVAVNRASTGESRGPLTAAGSINNMVPIMIKSAKLRSGRLSGVMTDLRNTIEKSCTEIEDSY
jgi:hypothetical protein